MEMSRLRTTAASLTTTADSSARCHMPNHARDPLIDHPAPLMAWRTATATAAPLHRCSDADSATPPPPAAAAAAAMAAAVLPRPPRPRLPMPRRRRRPPLTPGPLQLPDCHACRPATTSTAPAPSTTPLPNLCCIRRALTNCPSPEATGKRPEDSSLLEPPCARPAHGHATGWFTRCRVEFPRTNPYNNHTKTNNLYHSTTIQQLYNNHNPSYNNPFKTIQNPHKTPQMTKGPQDPKGDTAPFMERRETVVVAAPPPKEPHSPP